MLKKVSTLKLIGALVVLVLIYFAIEYFNDTGRSESFRSELVAINPDKVTKIRLTTGDNSTELNKEAGQWTVTLPSGGIVSADENKVNSTLDRLTGIKPSRIVTRNQEKWSEYKVDTSGTRVQVYEGPENTLDLVIGRFGARSQREMYTYVRLQEDDEVYVADNFMSFSVSPDANSYRNQKFLTLTPDSLNAIRFNYPDSAFILEKSLNDRWLLDDIPVDSASVAGFISGIQNLSSNKFVDDVKESQLGKSFDVSFGLKGQDDLFIDVFVHPDRGYIFRSSLNTNALFSDENLVNKLLKSRSEFLTSENTGNQ